MPKFRDSATLVLLPLLLWLCFLAPSFYGLDFGKQWDEDVAKLDGVKNTLSSGIFLQYSPATGEWAYQYGGVNYLLTWAGLTPELIDYFRQGPLTREALSARISPELYTLPLRLRIRAIYLILSSLAIPWLFYLAIVLGRSKLEAFVAAAILASSWEFAYHSRYMAPDVLMAQFVLLSFLCLSIGWSRPDVSWLYFGAVAVGVATGTKYPAVLILPAFLVGAAYVMWRQGRPAARIAGHCASLAGAAGLTFLITTPGVVLDPFNFFDQIQVQRRIYSTGWYGYTVRPGFSHLMKILKYFMLQGFSHYWTLSIVLMIFCVVGFAVVIVERKLFGFLLVASIILYVAYFSLQAAMIVRNLMVILPFLCLGTARGVTWAAGRWARPRPVLYACLGLVLSANFGWQVFAADQIAHRKDMIYFAGKFESYVRSDPQNTYFITPGLSRLLARDGSSLPANIVRDYQMPHSRVALLQSEGPEEPFADKWPSNSWGLYDAYFGALEANMEAYTTFAGNERILVVSAHNMPKLWSFDHALKAR